VVGGARDDAPFDPCRGAMIDDPHLLSAYDELKHRHDGSDDEIFTNTKGEFIRTWSWRRSPIGMPSGTKAGRVERPRLTPVGRGRQVDERSPPVQQRP
jgi:hypothetical protein